MWFSSGLRFVEMKDYTLQCHKKRLEWIFLGMARKSGSLRLGMWQGH